MGASVGCVGADSQCHIFPEGRVTQGEDKLRRFRWGVSRLLLETADIDVQVVPIWLQDASMGLRHR